jgi:hypothetical protein
MKRILILLALVSTPVWAQPTLLISLDPGLNLYNSENSLKTIGNKTLDWSPGFSVGCEGVSLWGIALHLEYSYTRSFAADAIVLLTTRSSGPEPIAYVGADLSFTTHNLDIDALVQPVPFLVLAFGPTVSLTHRTVEFTQPPSEEFSAISFQDRLASVCLGVNTAVDFRISLGNSPQHFLLFAGVRLRYLHSVFFDERGRNLGNYSQSQLFGRISVGFGYTF